MSGGNDFRNKFRGDSEIYLNKYDPVTHELAAAIGVSIHLLGCE